MLACRVVGARTSTRQIHDFAEKEFYLDEFRSHALLLSLQLADVTDTSELAEIGRVIGELIVNDARVMLLLGGDEPPRTKYAAVSKALQSGLRSVTGRPQKPQQLGRNEPIVQLEAALDPTLRRIWRTLRNGPLFIGAVASPRLLAASREIAGRLRIHKWVVLQSDGGIGSTTGHPISFMDDSMLTEVLRAGTAEWTGIDHRRNTLTAIQQALRTGVAAINLCSPQLVATELFTYEGSGTLFTLEDYCQIERLGIDDFDEVQRLLERGHAEGFLKSRRKADVAEILLNGFGATVGHHHLAGVVGLLTEQYRRAKAGEVAGLYTMTRFKTEGIGGSLLRHLVQEARTKSLRYVFACTTDGNAAAFFARHGFNRVARSRVPAAKWLDYESTRLERLTTFRLDLAP